MVEVDKVLSNSRRVYVGRCVSLKSGLCLAILESAAFANSSVFIFPSVLASGRYDINASVWRQQGRRQRKNTFFL